jgi:hypothetical protein
MSQRFPVFSCRILRKPVAGIFDLCIFYNNILCYFLMHHLHPFLLK